MEYHHNSTTTNGCSVPATPNNPFQLSALNAKPQPITPNIWQFQPDARINTNWPSTSGHLLNVRPHSTYQWHHPLNVHHQVQSQANYGSHQPQMYTTWQTQPSHYTPRLNQNEVIYEDKVVIQNSRIVSHINGKEGSRIKPLSAKYNTRIIVPQFYEPIKVFVIQGKRENVIKVKQDILIAADRFSKHEIAKEIRRQAIMGSEDSVTYTVHVPSALIGHVIGKNGRWARRIQSEHEVHIKTPQSSQQDPNDCQPFLVTGRQANVSTVVTKIYYHLCGDHTYGTRRIKKVTSGLKEVRFIEFAPIDQQPSTGAEVLSAESNQPTGTNPDQ